jgi:hypothetical protein
MRLTGGFGIFPYVELAKHYEHNEADYAKALEMVEEAMIKLRAMGFAPGSAEHLALARRRDRLLIRTQENCKGE